MSEILLRDINKNSALSNTGLSNGYFDIVKDYSWTLTDGSKRPDVPYVELVEFEQDLASFFAQISYWSSNIPTSLADVENPYENLYHAKATGTIFKIPYFGTYNHNVTQNWEKNNALMESFGGLGQKLINAAGLIGVAAGDSPGINVNQPHKWNGGSLAQYDITFTLFNIMTETDYGNNKNFIDRIILSSLHNQKSSILASPPAIFTISIPGVRYCPAAVINNVIIQNSGQVNLIDGKNVPDAFDITLNISELIQESRQIFKASLDNSFSKVVAINETQTVVQKIQAKIPR